MSIKEKKKELIKAHFEMGGMVILSILGIAGAIMVYYSRIFDVYDLNSFKECLSNNGILLIFGGFFLIIALFCWLIFFLNVVLNPKKDVVYIYKDSDGDLTIIGKNGKKYDYDFDTKNIKKEGYYNVLRTHDYIYEILDKTEDNWEVKERKSYWLNFYTPYGNYEDIMLIPIAYVILLPGLISILLSVGYQKIFGIIFCLAPAYFIIYDAIYKIRMKNGNYEPMDLTKARNFFILIKKVIAVIVVLAFTIFFIKLFFEINDIKSQLIVLPFILAFLSALLYNLAAIFDSKKYKALLLKIYLLLFMIFTIVLIFFSIYSLSEDGFIFGEIILIIGYVLLLVFITSRFLKEIKK